MTHEQKPESTGFRARGTQINELSFDLHEAACSVCWSLAGITAEKHILEAEARGAAEQRRKDEPEFEKIIAERDEAEDFIREMAEAVLGGVVEWSNVYGFQNALNDVSERIFFLEKDAEGAVPVAWLVEQRGVEAPFFTQNKLAIESQFITGTTPLYTRPANVTALEARVKELEERLHYLTGMGSDNSSYGPRIIDLCFTAFMRRAAGENEDGGSCDWFNDTRPHIAKQIERIRAAAIREGGEHG